MTASPTGRSFIRQGLLGLAAALLLGCAGRPTLVPAPDATIVPDGGMAARAESAGVSIVAEAGAWRGDLDIEAAVTPLHVTIENDSGRLLRIQYSDIGLVAEDGTRYAALPPYDIEGSISAPAMARRYAPIGTIAFGHIGFRIAAHYGPIYPTLAPYDLHRLYYDPYYYSFYYPYWDDARLRVELPTPEMLRQAVPEGVLEDGGELQGFFYFERVPQQLSGTRINFHFDLVDTVSGERFATLHIPFVATSEGSD